MTCKPHNSFVRGTSLALFLALAVACGGAQQSLQDQAANGAEEKSSGFLHPLVAKHVEKTVPSGTLLTLRMDRTVSSKGAGPGDRFTARVVEPVTVGGVTVIGVGSEVSGTVLDARPLKRIGGKAMLHLSFTSVDPVGGNETPIQASFYAEGKSETKKDAATIGGAAVGGALLGRVLNHDHEANATAVGAVVGAGVGTAIAAKTKGQEITLALGAQIQVRLEAPVVVSIRS